MSQTPRERARTQTMAEILTIGRHHLELHGAAGLSLRAVARDLGVVSSAVYRYVKSRDELLTLLVVDGYNALGDAVDAAVGAVPQNDFSEQFRAWGGAIRQWALAEPARYGLLFGSPVPGYDAPAEQTTQPGTRVVVLLMQILQRAYESKALTAPVKEGSPPLAADFELIRADMEMSVPDHVFASGALVWVSVFGAVNFEVFGQYGTSTFSDPVALFESHMKLLEELVGLR